jgi:hypothetical protein
MKPDQDDRLEARGVFSQPGECSLGGLQPPEIVGQVENPLLERMRRLWWRALDRICESLVLMRLSVYDCICGPEPPFTCRPEMRC